MKSSEKPLITIYREVLFEKQKEFALELKNIGKHTAIEINLKCGSCPLDQPEHFKLDKDTTYVNPSSPDGTFSIRFPLPVTRERLVYLLFTYRDVSNPKKKYASEFWFTHKHGEPGFRDQTIEDKSRLLPFVEELLPQRKKLFKA